MGVNLIIKGADFSLNGFRVIPDDFQELKSITSLYFNNAGSSVREKTYIFNTDKFVLDSAWEITFIGEFVQKRVTYQYLFSDFTAENTPVARVIFGEQNTNNLIINYNTIASQNDTMQFNFSPGNLYTIKLNSQNISVNDETRVLTRSQQAAVEKTVPMGISLFGFKIHNFNMANNREVVLDYIPVRRKSDNALGFYDTIEKMFLELDNTKQLVEEEL